MQTVTPSLATRWWREPELWLSVLLVLGVYLTRLGDLTIRGEESRRICVAEEMIVTGDWLVPCEQRAIFAERPPLANWIIAGLIQLTGSDGPWVVRLPSVLATLLTVILIYAYSRTFMSRLGAVTAAAGYATMLQVMALGGLAENEALMTLFMAAAMMFWHWGYSQQWPRWQTWIIGYTCAGLAWYIKGVQGPVYFGAAVVVFLLVRRDWKTLFSFQHLLGILSLLLVIGLWEVPFAWKVGWQVAMETWTDQVGKKMSTHSVRALLSHLASYPPWIWSCMFPWSVLLIAYATRPFRAAIADARSQVVFLSVAIAITFPTVWIAVSARSRYFMLLYPCFAPLCGLVLERAYQAAANSEVRKAWSRFFIVSCLVMTAFAVGTVGWGVAQAVDLAPHIQPLWFSLIYAAISLALAVVAWQARVPRNLQWATGAVLAVAVFWGLSFTGLATNLMAALSGDVGAQIAEVKRHIPANQKLVSFGIVHHLFRYHYHEPIERLAYPPDAAAENNSFEYFCIHRPAGRIKLPFAWEQLAVIPCSDRRKYADHEVVVVGRRLPEGTAQRPSQAAQK